MSDQRQVNEADLDWLAERDQPLTDMIRQSDYTRQEFERDQFGQTGTDLRVVTPETVEKEER